MRTPVSSAGLIPTTHHVKSGAALNNHQNPTAGPDAARPHARASDVLRLYAIVRTDIPMSSGKAMAQAGHAYVDALMSGIASGHPDSIAYASERPGTKITLAADIETIIAMARTLEAHSIPHALIVDSGHIEPPAFDGKPIVTALGVGPLLTARSRKLMRRLPLWKGGTA